MNSKTAGIVFDPAKSKAKDEKKVKDLIEEAIKSGITRFICSPSSEAEVTPAEYIESRSNGKLFLECIIPFEDVAAVWDEELRDRFFLVMEKCGKETLLRTRYSDDAIRNKNEYISSHSNFVISLNE